MSKSTIKKNVHKILAELPDDVQVVAACKMRIPEEIQAAIDAGIKIIGENYVQEAEEAYQKVTGDIEWHFIGHLQKNKVNRAVKICDMIESLDSFKLAKRIDSQCEEINKVMKCLVEINSGREEDKYGIMPEEAEGFVKEISGLKNIKILGLMTMGPFMGNPDEFRPYFRLTRELFEDLKRKDIPGCSMKYLSMGMSFSYKIAVEEGANIVRIGTEIFGTREPQKSF